MKNLIILCFAGKETNGSLTSQEMASLKKTRDDLNHGVLRKYLGEKTTIYCGNSEEDSVLLTALRILNPEQKINVGQKPLYITRKINFLCRGSAKKQSIFVNNHLKALYFSKKRIPTEVALMTEEAIKKSLSFLVKGPKYKCNPEILKNNISVGTAFLVKVSVKEIDAVYIN